MKSFLSPGRSHKIMNSVLIFSGVLTISVLVIILAFILIEGLPAIDLEFIFGGVKDQGRSGGIFRGTEQSGESGAWQQAGSVLQGTLYRKRGLHGRAGQKVFPSVSGQ